MTFFGPDLRNGLPIGLGSVAGFGIAPQFSPASLFLGGTVNGAWYDPSDATTLFSDRAGTTPCATPGAGAVVPVGLMLDKSQGLALGSEALTNPGPGFTVTTGWTSGRAATLSIASGTLRVTNTVAYGQAYQAITTVVGTTYRVTVTVANAATLFDIFVGTTGPETGLIVQRSNNAAGTYTFYFTATTTTSWLTFGNSGGSAGNAFDLVSATLKALAGNHAIAANDTTARPELSARVNLLTYSEQFNNAAWVTTNASKGTTTGTLPDGTTGTVHSLTLQGAATSYVYQTNSFASGQIATFAIYVRLPSGSTATDVRLTTNNNLAWNTGISQKFALTSSWQRLQLSGTVTTTGTVVNVIVGNTDAAGNRDTSIPAGVIEIWGADLRPANIGSQIPAYQRVVDANTYDSAGFPRRLVCNGTSSAMSTPANVNLSGTDKVTVFAGVRKNSDATIGVVMETSTISGSSNGAFMLTTSGQTSAGAKYGSSLHGTSLIYAETAAAYSAPLSNVLALSNDIAQSTAATEQIMRINGAQVALTFVGANAGTGNFGSYPLFIGARNNSSLFLNGDIYSLIVVGSAVSAGSITATETWVNGKTGGVY